MIFLLRIVKSPKIIFALDEKYFLEIIDIEFSLWLIFDKRFLPTNPLPPKINIFLLRIVKSPKIIFALDEK